MWERLKVSAEAYAIRGRGLSRTAVQLVGIAAVVIGAYNFLLAPAVVTGPVATIYRDVAGQFVRGQSAVLADIGLMAVGAVVAWFV